MVRFKGGMWCKGWVDSVTNFCSTFMYMQVVLNYLNCLKHVCNKNIVSIDYIFQC